MRKIKFLCVASLLLGSLGCGVDHGGRQSISGSVRLRDDAIQKGTIEFTSSSGAHQSGCMIELGKYFIPATKRLPPGKYSVRISAIRERTPTPDGLPGPEATKHTSEELVPPEYNKKTFLTAEVTKREANSFDFNLQ